MDAAASLRGAGHFTLWFLIGHMIFVALRQLWRGNDRLRLWGPFLPFVLGSIAVIPYLLQVLGLVSRATTLGAPFLVFLLYPLTEQAAWAQRSFGSFHLNTLLVSLAYLHLVHHYIDLIRHLPRPPRQPS